jgi:DNA polymerase III epsilon subunit-like protein
MLKSGLGLYKPRMIMENECVEWLKECRKVFPKLRLYKITCSYTKVPENILGRAKGKVLVKRDVDPEALLLHGIAKAKIKRKVIREVDIEINEKLKEIRNPLLRKQVVQHTIIHELLHFEKKDLLTLSKSYGKRKIKKIHKKEFEELVFERFNQLRKLNNLPEIRSKEDLRLAISKILSDINFHEKS